MHYKNVFKHESIATPLQWDITLLYMGARYNTVHVLQDNIQNKVPKALSQDQGYLNKII